MINPTRREALAISAGAVLGSTLHASGPDGQVLIVVGPSNHPPGTHEVAAGGRLIKHGLDQLLKGQWIRLITDWPQATPAEVRTVVFIGDLFPAAVMPESERMMADLTAMMAKGCGIVCLHYATGLEAKHVKDDGDHPLLHWLGGYFATRCKHHQSVAKVFQKATIEPAKAEHPVLRGWKAFTLHDEPYINNYFGKDGPTKGVTILANAELPPEKPKAEPVAWCIERADTGRGVGIVMPHFYRNWKDKDLRTLIFNAIAWTAKAEVPKDGLQVELPDLSTFKPAALEPIPRKK